MHLLLVGGSFEHARAPFYIGEARRAAMVARSWTSGLGSMAVSARNSMPDSPRLERWRAILPATQQMIRHFSTLLDEISQAAQDHTVTKEESREIRLCWDKLKAHAEAFVRACENGEFRAKG